MSRTSLLQRKQQNPSQKKSSKKPKKSILSSIALNGFISERDIKEGRISKKYVLEDYSGEVIPITEKWIRRLIAQSLVANVINLSPQSFTPILQTARNLAEVAGKPEWVKLVDEAERKLSGLIIAYKTFHLKVALKS